MEDMNAKDLLRRKVIEADETPVPPGHSPGTPPPGREYPPMPPRRLPPRRSRPGEGVDDPVGRMVGREEAPRGQFSPGELSQLKDVVIMMLAEMAHSQTDMQIAQAFMTGQELEPGLLQHILDEARNLQIPESHGALMQKIFTKLQQ